MYTHARGRARLGVLVPYTNVNLEADMEMLRPEGLSIHVARLGGYDLEEVPDEKQMAGLGASDIDETLRLLAGAKPDVILYGCTSATLTHGADFDKRLAQKIHQLCGAPTVTAAGGIVEGLRELGVTRIAFASPYVKAINDLAISFLAESGFETVSRADYPKALGNYGQGELTPEEVFALGMEAICDEAEALVLSCTDMRGAEVIEALELATGRPVISSNQAMLHAALKRIGVSPGPKACGRLMRAGL